MVHVSRALGGPGRRVRVPVRTVPPSVTLHHRAVRGRLAWVVAESRRIAVLRTGNFICLRLQFRARPPSMTIYFAPVEFCRPSCRMQ